MMKIVQKLSAYINSGHPGTADIRNFFITTNTKEHFCLHILEVRKVIEKFEGNVQCLIETLKDFKRESFQKARTEANCEPIADPQKAGHTGGMCYISLLNLNIVLRQEDCFQRQIMSSLVVLDLRTYLEYTLIIIFLLYSTWV